MDGAELVLPPGFRFHPTDEELVTHYLCRRCAGFPVCVPIIAEVNIYKHDPWQLPGMAAYGEKEWYFFSPRDRKYPNGSRPNRTAGSGYWKATGVDKPIGSPRPVAIKKALVFYAGKAPKGVKTNWIMHEYRLAGVDRSARKKNNLRLDDWVLCRLYHKKGGATEKTVRKAARAKNAWPQPKMEILPRSEILCFDVAEELPPLRSDSNCSSARVVSPVFKCDKEVESQVKWGDWLDDIEFPLIEGEVTGSVPPMSPVFSNSLQDVLVYLHRPF